ncbi:MarR family winged helix-turn-helix transcriptional regulator [Paraburkholderia sp. GAS41]|uniref:MarR family winged helix-turn-helix transcriptional regulator n=1 Tax=Paraburkholderia sp. GAS41 TaxID=3035134 RepID=UPI003D1EE6FC
MTKNSGETKMGRNRSKARTEEKDLLAELTCTNTAVRLAARRLGTLYDEAFDAVGLKATQVSVLAEIDRLTAENDGAPPTLQDLAIRLAIQISAVTHALRPLIRDGLVELRPDETDGRAKRAALTRMGAARVRQAFMHWTEVNERVEGVLGRKSAAALRALADHIASDEFLAAYESARAKGPAAPGT